jgi:16S rRNA (cytosine1402-N4)-methyltransferase
MSDYHTSVLLREAIDYLQVKPGEKYIDATLGGGGHTLQILEKGGIVLGLDVDTDAIEQVQLAITNYELGIRQRLVLAKGNFREISRLAQENNFEHVAGILFDLGVSSHQFDEGEKGFSFQKDAPLDMRMDRELGVTAADLINALGKDELLGLFVKYGEEQYAGRIVRVILEARKTQKIATTKELSDIIEKIYPKHEKRIHPATEGAVTLL